MSDTKTTDVQFALAIQPSGRFELIEWPTGGNTLKTLYDAIGCNRVDVVDVTTQLSMWVDDEGAYTAPINQFASRLYGRYQPLSQPYFGAAVFTGGVNSEGDTVGLDQDQALTLLTRYLDIQASIMHNVDIADFPRQQRND